MRAWIVAFLTACASPPIEIPCSVDPPAPCPEGSSYLGVHANRENNDVVACDTGSAYTPVWHSPASRCRSPTRSLPAAR